MGLVVLLAFSPILSAQTTTPSPAASPAASPHQPPQQDEQAFGIAMRTKFLAKLPPDSVTVLDQPYVEHPVKGSRPASDQTLDLFVPPGKGPFPLIVWIHGGAWKGGNKEQLGAEMASRWLPEGFAVASINYRFVVDAAYPAFFEDCNAALAWLRGHAAQYHLDPVRVGVIGASAGGHIAGAFVMAEGTGAYKYDGPPVQAAVLMCGFYDMTKETGQWKEGAFIANPRDDFAGLYPNRTYDPDIARKISPVYLLHAGIPPVLIMHGDKDTTAPAVQSELFEKALKDGGYEVEYKRYPDYTHNLWKPDAIADALAFFKKHLQP